MTPAKIAGAISDESEGEREGKEGEKREGITGSDFPLLCLEVSNPTFPLFHAIVLVLLTYSLIH